MSNVIIDREKIDILANAISDKSGIPVTMTLDEMVEAVDGIETGSGAPNLQAKTYTVDSAGTETITADSGYDGLSEVEVSVPSANPDITWSDRGFYTESNQRKWRVRPYCDFPDGEGYGWMGHNEVGNYLVCPAVPSNTTITPTTSGAYTIGGANYMMEGAVTVSAMPTGTAGTPTATKGTVSNHSISVTPSVTNTTGYITGSTKTGTAVTVTASELVSGSQTITINGTYDVTNLASIVAAVQVGADIPIFTVDLTANPVTATCNKTYAECVSAYNNDYEAWGIATVTTQYNTTHMATSAVEYQQSAYMRFTVYSERGIPAIDLMYYPNESIMVVNPSAMLVEAGTPTATKGTVSSHSVAVTPSVTNTAGYVTSGTKTGTAVTVSASELVSGTYTVDSSGTKDVTNYASASVPAGTAGTPSASKGAVSNHSVSVTPSVTNTTGWITGSTKTGTAVTVSASELVSGSETKTANGTYDVTNLASLVVNVSGGGGSSMQIGNLEGGATSTSSISFTGLQGEPTAFSFMIDASVATGTPSKIVAVVFDGTSLHAQTITNTTNAQVTYDSTSLSKTYSNGTLTITSNGPSFVLDYYYGVYTYSGGTVDTKDVQVGSGATSITFTGLEAEPAWWSCIFKSNFSTSSGYQRVIYVAEGSTTGNVSGLEMDSGAHNTMHWTASYNNGSFTITSQGTNQGGYFHQPGYYQFTYAYDDGSSGNYQSKTVTPTTSQQVITADSGYDALKQVTVNAMPTGSATAPSKISGTSATVSTGTNTLTLTKTISVTPTVSAGYVSSGTAGNSSVSLTASVTTKAAATITPTTTNQTIAAGTYLTGIQTIAGDADLVGGNILSTANIFGVQGTVVVQNYYTGSSAPSSSLGSNGDLYLQS